MSSIKLYYSPISGPSRACYWSVIANNAEKDVECILVKLEAGEHLTPEFLAINPYHTVPTLKDESNGVILYESGAILQYLAERLNWTAVTIPSAKDDLKTRFKAISYLHWHHYRIYQGISKATLGRCAILYGMATAIDNEAIKAAITAAKEWLPIFDRQLGENGGFIAGNVATLADLQAYTHIAYLRTYEYGIDVYNYGGYENIQAWFTKVEKVDGFTRVHDQVKFFVDAVAGLGPSSNVDSL